VSVEVRRCTIELRPDASRVIGRPYLPSEQGPPGSYSRVRRLVDRVVALPSPTVAAELADVRRRFDARHVDLMQVIDRSYEELAHHVPIPPDLSPEQRALLGAYVSHEYSIEAAALTNPSLVVAPDQAGVPEGSLRIVVSLRAVGEGHISSIEFRTGLVDEHGEVTIDPPDPPVLGHRRRPVFDRSVFEATLAELVPTASLGGRQDGHRRGPVDRALERLDERFTMEELEVALQKVSAEAPHDDVTAMMVQTVHWLAMSNYELVFPSWSSVSSRVIFPEGPAESHGMEDLRLVRFARDDGTSVYYGTYTAFDGMHVLPQLIVSEDLTHFRMATLTGATARNKGIALFPRALDGRYAALARSDNENNFLMFSEHVRIWETADRIQVPVRPWELMQIGNAGAPIETEAGWLVITHGVGPMRTYALGAVLLDIDEPGWILGHLREPLLLPEEDERDGYVPNVVYSCGQVTWAGNLILAYGASDTTTRFAVIDLDELLSALTSPDARPS
jgi:predicted GH43/DUF377 family glycosyl hydrolase